MSTSTLFFLIYVVLGQRRRQAIIAMLARSITTCPRRRPCTYNKLLLNLKRNFVKKCKFDANNSFCKRKTFFRQLFLHPEFFIKNFPYKKLENEMNVNRKSRNQKSCQNKLRELQKNKCCLKFAFFQWSSNCFSFLCQKGCMSARVSVPRSISSMTSLLMPCSICISIGHISIT